MKTVSHVLRSPVGSATVFALIITSYFVVSMMLQASPKEVGINEANELFKQSNGEICHEGNTNAQISKAADVVAFSQRMTELCQNALNLS